MKFAVSLKELQDKLRMIASFISSLSEMDSDPIVLIEAKRLKGGVRRLRFTCANEQMYTWADLDCAEVSVKGECAVPLHYLRSLRAKKGSILRVEITDTTLKGIIENPNANNTKLELDILVETETVKVMFPDVPQQTNLTLPKSSIVLGILAIDFQPVQDEETAPIRIDFEKTEIQFSLYDPYRFGYIPVEVDKGLRLPVGQSLILDRDPIMLVLDQVSDDSTFGLYVGETMYAISADGFHVEFQKLNEFNMPEDGYDPRESFDAIGAIKKAGSAIRVDPEAFAEAISDVSTISTRSLASEARMVMTLGKTSVNMAVSTEVGDMAQQAPVVKIVTRKVKVATVNAMYFRELLLLAAGDEAVVRWDENAVVIESAFGSILSCSLLD